MLFSEIAVQNVAGYPAAARLPLRAGLNALVSRETDLFLILRALLWAGPDDVTALRSPGTPRKIALTIVGDDGASYRLVRDLDGGRTLLRSDPSTRQPIKLSEDPAEITRLLETSVGLPTQRFLQGQLWLAASDLPSRQAPKAPRPGPDHLPATATAAEPVTFTAEEARHRLPEIREELGRAERFEAAQDTLYQQQQRLAELQKGSASIVELEQKIAELTQKIDGFQRYKDVIGGIEARVRKFPEAVARRDGALQALQKKRAEYQAAATAKPDVSVLLRDPMVLGGFAAGIGCLAGAILFSHNLYLLDPIPFGIAAFGAWRWVSGVEGADVSVRRLADLDELEKKIQRTYEAETAPVLTAMATIGVSSPDEVLHKLEERDMLDARRVALVRELEQKRADPRMQAHERERESVEADFKAREAIVNGMGFTRDAAVIRRELEAAEEAVAKAATEDPIAQALDLGAEHLQVEPRALVEGLRDRLAQYMAALTDRRFVGVRVLGPGQCVVVAANGAAGPINGLPPADRDLIYISVRLAMAERIGGAAKRPLVFDEPSVLVDPPHRALFVKMLKSLGAVTQVIVRAYEAPPATVVDHIASVGTTAA